ncbi:MAG TPA: RNA methyltransferase [Ignavibacteriaceae bacterium]|nr:RNA methyltransferase [Ignavibacteriaceae bacterium]
MITKNQVKYYSSLLQKKNRFKEKKFLTEGLKNVEEGLNSSYECELIFVTNKFTEENEDYLKRIRAKTGNIISLKQKELQKISDSQTPQGIAAVFIKPSKLQELKNSEEEIIVYLDNVSDPGNLGTIIRNCDWFGVNKILLSDQCVEYTNPKVVRSSAGSLFHVDIYEDIGIVELKKLKEHGYRLITADVEGENIYDMKRDQKIIIAFSNEANGPSDQLLKISDRIITIPKAGNTESLNVASASAVILSEFTKSSRV